MPLFLLIYSSIISINSFRIEWTETNFLHILEELINIYLLFLSFRTLSSFFSNIFYFIVLIIYTRIYLVKLSLL